MIGIYKIKNLVNGKVYIGQSIDIDQRWRTHRSSLRKNYHENDYLQNAWNKYGESNFQFSIIEECDELRLDDLEKKWVEYYNSCEREHGYNIESGGHVNTYYRPVLRFSLYGDYIDEWKSPREASIQLGINAQVIYHCCNKTYKYGGGYIWIFKDDYTGHKSIQWYLDRKNLNRILQVDRNANIVKIWNSVSDISKELGYSVSACLTHKTYTAHGYIFIYENECDKITKDYCETAFTALSNINNHPFYQISADGDIIKKYNTLRDAEEDGYNEKMINECIKGQRIKYKNNLWIYVDKYNENNKEYYRELIIKKEERIDLPILQFKNGILIRRYEHLKDLPKEYNKTNVSSVCKGRKPQYKGYIWKYELDE